MYEIFVLLRHSLLISNFIGDFHSSTSNTRQNEILISTSLLCVLVQRGLLTTSGEHTRI